MVLAQDASTSERVPIERRLGSRTRRHSRHSGQEVGPLAGSRNVEISSRMGHQSTEDNVVHAAIGLPLHRSCKTVGEQESDNGIFQVNLGLDVRPARNPADSRTFSSGSSPRTTSRGSTPSRQPDGTPASRSHLSKTGIRLTDDLGASLRAAPHRAQPHRSTGHPLRSSRRSAQLARSSSTSCPTPSTVGSADQRTTVDPAEGLLPDDSAGQKCANRRNSIRISSHTAKKSQTCASASISSSRAARPGCAIRRRALRPRSRPGI